MNTPKPLLRVENLSVHFHPKRSRAVIRAVDGVSFEIPRGQTLGLVGESGCGKSTTGRAILRLIEPTAGRIEFDGADLAEVRAQDLRTMRSRMAMVFQDPNGSLDPTQTIGSALEEPLIVHGIEGNREARRRRVSELLDLVGMSERVLTRMPREFSGGQRQRIVIARALMTRPDFVVFDEPIAALDASIQAQMLNLILDLQAELDLTYLFITHDLAAVEYVSTTTMVMYLGKVVERAESRELAAQPAHPYTKALSSAVLEPTLKTRERERVVLKGDPPDPGGQRMGCPFQSRCWVALPECVETLPELLGPPTHETRCFVVNGHPSPGAHDAQAGGTP